MEHMARKPEAAAPGRNFQGHFFIGGIFKIQVGFLGELIKAVADFRGRGAGIRGCQRHPGFQGASHNGFIAQQQTPFSRLTTK